WMRHAESCRVGHGGMLPQHLVDLLRSDLLAPTIDNFAQPAGQKQKPVLVEIAEIAGATPAVYEHLGAQGGGAFVAGEHPCSAHDHFPRFAHRQSPSRVIVI